MADTILDGTIAALRDFRRTLPSTLHRPFDVAVAQAVAGEFAVEICDGHVTFTGTGALVRFGPADEFEEVGHG